MKKIAALLCLLLTAGHFLSAQNTKKMPGRSGTPKSYTPEELKLRSPKAAVPPADDPLKVPAPNYKPLSPLVPVGRQGLEARVTRSENGMPIFFEGFTEKSAAAGLGLDSRALNYLAELAPDGLKNPEAEFKIGAVQTDEQGNAHVRAQQMHRGVPVYGAELIAHTKNGLFSSVNGRYYPTPDIDVVQPVVSAEQATTKVKARYGARLKTTWTTRELEMVGGQPFIAELVIYHHERALGAEHLAWHIVARPNLMDREVFFVDARSGALIHHFKHVCNIAGGAHRHDADGCDDGRDAASKTKRDAAAPPPVNGSGLDLFDVNRTFGAWQDGSVFYMEDASKSMFKAAASKMPNDPVGAIVTLDAFNTTPTNQNTFNYDIVVSNGAVFNNKSGVSAHWNAIKSFDYFKSTFNRNSIDGVGGNILSFVNVADEDGSTMENAFWNGAAMWYGNGGTTFRPLARGLDVGGHEITHGVVEKTANLEYQDESGALNESFADVFGVMIDRDDWKVGEDVVKPGVSPGGALRDMQNPYNGDATNGNWWQPKKVSEQYKGTQDNGGVHINSGIPNHAFYLFATNAAVGKEKAEQVYYKALRDYLVKSSRFIDCRIAVIQAANDLYGTIIAAAAAAAFDAVGITGNQPTGNYLGQLPINPGKDYVLATSAGFQRLDLYTGAGVSLGTIYNQGIKSRPSINDDGTEMVFVNDAGHIIFVSLIYQGGNVTKQESELSEKPIWRNAALSKTGRFIAAVTDDDNEIYENKVYIFDQASPFGAQETYTLFNPTYSQTPTNTGEVRYADVLEFDYSDNYLMYDAFNELKNKQGESISYWDIGFLQFFENGQFADPDDVFISKLFNGIPENTNIGNPSFSKNSPYIIAFDFANEDANQYDVYGANVETGDYDVLAANNGDYAAPNFNRLDNAVILHRPNTAQTGFNIFSQPIASSKIKGQGLATQFIPSHLWGVWYGNGKRVLQVGASEVQGDFKAVTVSPNPVSDGVRLSFGALRSGDGRVELYDLTGALHQIRHVDFMAGENTLDLDLQNIPAGNYMLRVIGENAGAVVKIVKY
jgi:Zn-dependent metalloprotease